jgi:hypothetical protein
MQRVYFIVERVIGDGGLSGEGVLEFRKPRRKGGESEELVPSKVRDEMDLGCGRGKTQA